MSAARYEYLIALEWDLWDADQREFWTRYTLYGPGPDDLERRSSRNGFTWIGVLNDLGAQGWELVTETPHYVTAVQPPDQLPYSVPKSIRRTFRRPV